MNTTKAIEALEAANNELHRIAWARTSNRPREGEAHPKLSVLKLCAVALADLEAGEATPSYVLSRDYEKLFVRLTGQWWAIGMCGLHDTPCRLMVRPATSPSGTVRILEMDGGWHYLPERIDEFVPECERLSLEWLAPAKPPAPQQDQGDEGVPAITPSGFPLQSFADDGKRISAAIPNAVHRYTINAYEWEGHRDYLLVNGDAKTNEQLEADLHHALREVGSLYVQTEQSWATKSDWINAAIGYMKTAMYYADAPDDTAFCSISTCSDIIDDRTGDEPDDFANIIGPDLLRLARTHNERIGAELDVYAERSVSDQKGARNERSPSEATEAKRTPAERDGGNPPARPNEQSSTPVRSVEEEARAWGIKNGLVHTEEERADLERRGDPGWDLEDTIIQWVTAFHAHMQSLVPATGHAEGVSAQGWMEIASEYAHNMEYYRGLVDRIGVLLGDEAYICEDGSRSEDILRAKVPELVERRLTPSTGPRAELTDEEITERAAKRFPDSTEKARLQRAVWASAIREQRDRGYISPSDSHTEQLEGATLKLACDRIDSVIIDAMKKAVTVNGDLNSIDRSGFRSAVWSCIQQSMSDAARSLGSNKTENDGK